MRNDISLLLLECVRDIQHVRSKLLRYVLDAQNPAVIDGISDAVDGLGLAAGALTSAVREEKGCVPR